MEGKTSEKTLKYSEGESSFRATTDYDDKTLHVNQSGQISGMEKLKKGSKIVGGGLRQYSIMVCKKVEDKGRITYSEVADEIIAEFMATESNSSVLLNESDEKNIRRRVYDSLNVLMALDIIERDRKEIRWKGLPNSDARDMEETKKRHVELMAKIGKKAAYLKDLEEQLASLQNLKLRNEQLLKSTSGPSQGFSLPFILVQTAPHAMVEVEISEDMQLVHFDFNSVPFSLHDDAYVLKLMRHYELLEGKNVSQTSSIHSSCS
ncbi:hypothetical protein RND71_038718 [Anisodus tanguticus]|uniref:Transcription factor-like protein DPA n=1 Tax=Anisodus tanguticus TaxID=243964 RepID=A0AAE1R376_9SOLA|nr:hypothetical protein RND71_038718 [Anisodus tanguticus]